jgi:predicted nucleic acid-binding protein
MIYKKIFVDSDILLDMLLKREEFVIYTRTLLARTKNDSFKLCTSTLILANIHYLVSKNISKKVAKESLRYLIGLITIVPFEEIHIISAINVDHVDFEDSIQYYIAKQNDCDLIISRNIKHYKKFDIPVLTAEQFLRTIL